MNNAYCSEVALKKAIYQIRTFSSIALFKNHARMEWEKAYCGTYL